MQNPSFHIFTSHPDIGAQQAGVNSAICAGPYPPVHPAGTLRPPLPAAPAAGQGPLCQRHREGYRPPAPPGDRARQHPCRPPCRGPPAWPTQLACQQSQLPIAGHRAFGYSFYHVIKPCEIPCHIRLAFPPKARVFLIYIYDYSTSSYALSAMWFFYCRPAALAKSAMLG